MSTLEARKKFCMKKAYCPKYGHKKTIWLKKAFKNTYISFFLWKISFFFYI